MMHEYPTLYFLCMHPLDGVSFFRSDLFLECPLILATYLRQASNLFFPALLVWSGTLRQRSSLTRF